MQLHHPLHHTTSSRERLQGAVTVSGCLPSGLAAARPCPWGCVPSREGSLSLGETDCDLTATFPALAPAAAPALPSQGRGSCQAARRPCQTLH